MKSLTMFALGILTVTVCGCQSFYGLIDPGSMEQSTTLTWESDLPDIEPIDSQRRIVYLSYKDASGSDLPNLRDDIRQSLEDCGYVVTRNSTEAWFTIEARCTYFGTQRKETGAGTIAGAIAGGAVGAGTGYAATDHTSGTLLGGGIGAGFGGIAANLADKHNPVRVYDFMLEISCRERIPEGFTESMLGSGMFSSSSGANTGIHGRTYTDTTTYENKQTDLVRKHEFYNHKNHLTISTSKRNLTEEEAYQAVVSRLSRAFSGIMPDVDPDIDPITPAEYLEQLKGNAAEDETSEVED